MFLQLGLYYIGIGLVRILTLLLYFFILDSCQTAHWHFKRIDWKIRSVFSPGRIKTTAFPIKTSFQENRGLSVSLSLPNLNSKHFFKVSYSLCTIYFHLHWNKTSCEPVLWNIQVFAEPISWWTKIGHISLHTHVCSRSRCCWFKWRMPASYYLHMMLIATAEDRSVLMWKPLLFLCLLSLTLVSSMRVCWEPGRSPSLDPFTAIVIQLREPSDSLWLTAELIKTVFIEQRKAFLNFVLFFLYSIQLCITRIFYL